MSQFYDAYRKLYTVLFEEKIHFLEAKLGVDDREEALRTTLQEIEMLLHGLEAALESAQNAGQNSSALFREVRRTTFIAGAIRDLLIEVADGSEEILAAKADIDAVNDKLGKLTKSAEKLATNLGKVSGVIDTVAKIVKLIG